MDTAEQTLGRAVQEKVGADWHARLFALGDDLYRSIRMQLSVSKYKAIGVDRGATLDTVDFPLNNHAWFKERFAAIRKLDSNAEQLRGIREMVNWTNPGPGGFYDDLGNAGNSPHLVNPDAFAGDPGSMRSPRVGFEEDLVADEEDGKFEGARRVSWIDHAETLYDTPLEMRYTGLARDGHYRVRVVYAGDAPRRRIRLTAGDGLEIHPLLKRPIPCKPLEFEIPSEAISSGELSLKWTGEPGLGGNGRGCQVSEVWLLKDAQTPAGQASPR